MTLIMKCLACGVFFVAALCLVGCTRQPEPKSKPNVAKAINERRDADVSAALSESSPEVKSAFAAASELALVAAVAKVGATPAKTPEEQRAMTAAQTTVIERALDPLTPRDEKEAAFREMEKAAPEEVKPLYQAAANRGSTPAQLGNAVKEAVKYCKGPDADPELMKMATDMKDIAAKMKTAKGSERKTLLNQLDAKSKEFDKRSKELGKDGQWEKVGGAVVAAAEVMSDVKTLSEGWDDKTDAEKAAGIIGLVGNCCLMVAPFLPPPANAIVAAVGAVLKVLEFIIPKLFGGGSGGDGQADGKKDEGGSKDANGNDKKPNGNTKPGSPGSAGAKGDGRAVTNASVAGAFADANGDPKKTAQNMGNRMGLSPGQTKKLEGAYEKSLKDNANKTPQEKAEALTDATSKAVPEIDKKAQEKAEKVKSKAERIQQRLEKQSGAKPEEIRRQAANLAANNNPQVAERVLITLQNVPTDNLAYLAQYATLMAFSFDPPTLDVRPPE